MTGREWKPGDVAAVRGRGDDGGGPVVRAVWQGNQWATENSRYLDDCQVDARPLVVIDPEDERDVDALADALTDALIGTPGGGCMRPGTTQAALRSLIAPPKPEEPTGLGAVVEESDGTLWVKWSTRHRADRNWKRHDDHGGNYLCWDDMPAGLSVLSEGVPS